MCRRIEEEVEPTVGLPRHRHFVGLFNVPVQTPTRDPPFNGYSEKPPHFSRLLRHAWRYEGHILDLNPGSPRGMLDKHLSKSVSRECLLRIPSVS